MWAIWWTRPAALIARDGRITRWQQTVSEYACGLHVDEVAL